MQQRWTLTQTHRSLEAFEMWTWRRIEMSAGLIKLEVLGRVNEDRQMLNYVWQRKHRWIGHVLRHDGLLHEIIEGRMSDKPTREELKCCMIWQMMVMLHSNGQTGQRGMETQKGCQKPALQQKFTD